MTYPLLLNLLGLREEPEAAVIGTVFRRPRHDALRSLLRKGCVLAHPVAVASYTALRGLGRYPARHVPVPSNPSDAPPLAPDGTVSMQN